MMKPAHFLPKPHATNIEIIGSIMTIYQDKPVLVIGAGISGLLLAQSLSQHGIPARVFERDADLETRGAGWGLTLNWSLPALRSLLPEDLVNRLPEAYVDRSAVVEGHSSAFPFFDLSTGELIVSTPKAPESSRIRVTRQGLRDILATGINIEVDGNQEPSYSVPLTFVLVEQGTKGNNIQPRIRHRDV
jgi:hypothetical protein